MFPIPVTQALTIGEIADYWSREERRATEQEVRRILIAAWWGGEFTEPQKPDRMVVLKVLYKQADTTQIVFEIPGVASSTAEQQLEDGSIVVDMRMRIALPSEHVDDWTIQSCSEAFEKLADLWDEKVSPLLLPALVGIKLKHSDFTAWVRRRGFDVPTFWDGKSRRSTGPREMSEDQLFALVRKLFSDAAPRIPTQEKIAKLAAVAAENDGFKTSREALRNAYRIIHEEREGVPRKVGRPRNSP